MCTIEMYVAEQRFDLLSVAKYSGEKDGQVKTTNTIHLRFQTQVQI